MIAWRDIEAQALDAEADILGIFQKYEGMTTDEKTAHGRPVKVNPSSFARHAGIPKMTFHDWLHRDSTVHRERTVACDVESPLLLMNDVKRQLARVLSPVYTLSKFDKARLVAILEDGLNALEEYDR